LGQRLWVTGLITDPLSRVQVSFARTELEGR
jgi:hypothetical protein